MVKNSIYKKNHLRNSILRNKKGMSAIIITVLLIALSMAAVVVVWVFINNMIKKQISSSESCFGNFDKVTINEEYTCYDSTNDILRFSLIVGDVDVDKIIVSVSSVGIVKSYTIEDDATISGLTMYTGTSPQTILLPDKNSGYTYNATGFTSAVDSVRVAPVIGGTQCEVSYSVSDVESCTS